MRQQFIGIAALVGALSVGAGAQDAATVISETSKAMGLDNVTSITYSGSAADVNFLQTKNINGPWPLRPITNYVRAIDLTQVASRASGTTMNQGLFGGAPVAGRFNQGITGQNVLWQQQLDYFVTPWGFLKGAAANNATVKPQKVNGRNYSVVSWMPPIKAPSGVAYRINGYVNEQHLVDRVETWVDHDMLGDMHVDTIYTDYKDFGALKVPTKIVQKRGGWTFFEVTIADAKANPGRSGAVASTAGASSRRGGARSGTGRSRCRTDAARADADRPRPNWPTAFTRSTGPTTRWPSSSRTTSSSSRDRRAWREERPSSTRSNESSPAN